MEVSEKGRAISQLKDWVTTHRTELLQSGIHTIVATYSGDGDSGCLDDTIEFVDGQGKAAQRYEAEDLYPLFEALYDALAPEGYENNEGGGEEFSVEIAAGSITHESYYLTIERSDNFVEEY